MYRLVVDGRERGWDAKVLTIVSRRGEVQYIRLLTLSPGCCPGLLGAVSRDLRANIRE